MSNILRIMSCTGNIQSVNNIDEQDSNSLDETAYLLRSPKNAKRLIEARYRPEKEAIGYSDLIESLKI